MNRGQGSENRLGRKRWYIASLILLAIIITLGRMMAYAGYWFD